MSIARADAKNSKKTGRHVFYRHIGPNGPKTPSLDAGYRGGLSPALREHETRKSLLPADIETGRSLLREHCLHRDQEVSPTRRHRDLLVDFQFADDKGG